jgi:hypothetical protein
MSFLTVNHNQAGGNNNNQQFTPIAEGDYEAIISEAKISTSQSGNPMITVTLTIRDDIQQQFTKRKVWDYLVDTEKAKFKFQQLAKALAIPEGTNIATIQDFAKAIQYACVGITIKNREEEYKGEKKVKDYVSAYKPSKAPARETTQADPFQTTPSPQKPSNNDLPF